LSGNDSLLNGLHNLNKESLFSFLNALYLSKLKTFGLSDYYTYDSLLNQRYTTGFPLCINGCATCLSSTHDAIADEIHLKSIDSYLIDDQMFPCWRKALRANQKGQLCYKDYKNNTAKPYSRRKSDLSVD